MQSQGISNKHNLWKAFSVTGPTVKGSEPLACLALWLKSLGGWGNGHSCPNVIYPRLFLTAFVFDRVGLWFRGDTGRATGMTSRPFPEREKNILQRISHLGYTAERVWPYSYKDIKLVPLKDTVPMYFVLLASVCLLYSYNVFFYKAKLILLF